MNGLINCRPLPLPYGGGFSTRILGEFLFPPLYALWLYGLTQAPMSLSYRVFCWKPFRLLGDWSFALYCLHYPVMEYYCWLRFQDEWWYNRADAGQNGLSSWEVIPVFTILLPLSAATYYWVEQPARSGLYARMALWVGITKPAYASRDSHESEEVHMMSQAADSDESDTQVEPLPEGLNELSVNELSVE